MSEAPQTGGGASLLARETIDGLRAACAEAELAAAAGEAGGAERLAVCRRVAEGVRLSDAGQAGEARAVLAAALAETRDPRLLYLGFQFFFRSKAYDEAEGFVRRRIEVLPAETPEAARAWNNLGLVYHFQGRADEAERAMRQALEIDRRIGCEEGIARDLGNLALIPEARGDLEAAEALYLESLAIAERIGADHIVASKVFNLGEIALWRGRRDKARAWFVRAEEVYGRLGDERMRGESARMARSCADARGTLA